MSFDKTEIYEQQLKPLLEKASDICTIYGIPFFSTCCVRDNGKKSEYRNVMSGSVSNNVRLADDHICRHINVANGFDTYLRDRGIEIEDDMDLEDFDDMELTETEDDFDDDFDDDESFDGFPEKDYLDDMDEYDLDGGFD